MKLSGNVAEGLQTATIFDDLPFAQKAPFMTRLLSLALLLAVFLGLNGCSSKSPTQFPVKGRVLFKGAPVQGALVVFHPRNPTTPNVERPAALTDAEGVFVLKTGAADGAAPGDYDVTVVCEKPGSSKGSAEDTSDIFAGKYSKPESSTLKINVKAEANQLANFELK